MCATAIMEIERAKRSPLEIAPELALSPPAPWAASPDFLALMLTLVPPCTPPVFEAADPDFFFDGAPVVLVDETGRLEATAPSDNASLALEPGGAIIVQCLLLALGQAKSNE